MFEFHGWASINDSTYESDDLARQVVVKDIRHFLERFDDGRPGYINFSAVNGSYHLSVSGMTNHYTQVVRDVFELYEFIANISIGSYGLLYTRSNESLDHGNEFEVFVLARGQITKRKDPFLSPCVPTIEDGDEVLL